MSLAMRGNPPTRRSVFTDAELLAKFPAYPVQLRSLENSRPRPRTPLWNEIENTFGIFLSKPILASFTRRRDESGQREITKTRARKVRSVSSLEQFSVGHMA